MGVGGRKEGSITGAKSLDNCGSNLQDLWRTMGQAIESPHSYSGHPWDHCFISASCPCLCAEAPA